VSTRIETSRLVIRTFEPRDAGAWIAMVNDPEVNYGLEGLKKYAADRQWWRPPHDRR
jgi:RimJ/RimL family protein N-acetyltransferase